MDKIETKKIYIYSIFLSLFIVELFFLFQVVFILENFELKFMVVPTLLGLTIGLLIGKIQVLRKRLAYKEKIFHIMADEATEFSYFRSVNGQYEYVSPSVQKLTGYTQEDFYNTPNFFDELIHEDDKRMWEEHKHHIEEECTHEHFDIRIINKKGNIIWVSHNCSAVIDENGNRVGIRSVNNNVTKQKYTQNAILKLAKFDTLTGLPNRKSLLDKIDKLILEKTFFALLFIDLNRFKKINDSLGHNIGDKVLKKVAKALQNNLEESIFIGRLGGDEFVILLENTTKKDEVELILEGVLKTIEQEYEIQEYKLYVGASIGIAFYPNDALNRRELLACADKAMYKAKDITFENVIYYDDIAVKNVYDDIILEKELRNAINEENFEVYLQPQVCARRKKIRSFEALVRWKKDGQIIPPNVFIGLAEEIGVIKEISKWMIKTVFALSHKWHNEGYEYRLAINLSAIDFMSDDIIDFLVGSLKINEVEPHWIELEITEGILLENNELVISRIQKLIDIGFHIALDDFGTGYSSLAYINKLPLDTLKIDKLFIDDLEHEDLKNLQLLKAIVAIAKNLDLLIVAEGVSSKKQVDILEALGCQILQGFYYYKPMPIDECEKLLEK